MSVSLLSGAALSPHSAAACGNVINLEDHQAAGVLYSSAASHVMWG